MPIPGPLGSYPVAADQRRADRRICDGNAAGSLASLSVGHVGAGSDASASPLKNIEIREGGEPSLDVVKVHDRLWIDVVDAVLDLAVEHHDASGPGHVVRVQALALSRDEHAAAIHEVLAFGAQRRH